MKKLPYFQLRAYVYHREKNRTVELKLKELENVWFCTQKNVKRKLKHYEATEHLNYIPGQGRGNPSRIIFSKSFQDEIKEAVSKCVKQDKLEDLVQLLQLPIPKSWIGDVSSEAQQLFGLKSPTKSQDILRTVVKRKITTLDPMYSSITFESHLIQQLSDTLCKYNQENDTITPHIAHHWKHDKTYKYWTFYLRKGILFHHEKNLTSADVKHTFERSIHSLSPNNWLVDEIESIDCSMPYVIHFKLKKSNPFFLRYVTSNHLAILPDDVPFNEHVWIGTGPFKLAKRNDQRIILEAFDSYFLERPFLDQIEFWRVPIDAFQKVTYQIGQQNTEQMPLQKQNIEIGFRFLSFNFNRKQKSVINNKAFREAIYHLLDMKKMWYELDREELIEASSFFPWKSKRQEKNATVIQDLLEHSNYQGETLTLYALEFPKAIEEANWLIHEAEKANITFELKTFSLDELYSSNIDDEADLLFIGEISSLDYHLSFLGAFYNKALIFRRFLSQQHLKKIDHYLDLMKIQEAYEDRETYITLVEEYLREEFLILYQHHPVKNRTFHPMIKDIKLDSFNQIDFRKIWIEK